MAEKLAVVTGAKFICTNATCTPEAAPDFISTNDATGFNYGGGESVACISDCVPKVNIFAFPGKCASGGPCKPEFPAPWINGVPSATDSGVMLLSEDSCIFCKKGGCITVRNAGQNEIKLLTLAGEAIVKNNEDLDNQKAKSKVKLKLKTPVGEAIELTAHVIKETVEVAEAAGEVGRSAAQAYVDNIKEMSEEIKKNMDEWEIEYNKKFE